MKLYPRLCGLNSEPDSRPGLSPVNPSSTPGALTSRGWPNKGSADVYPPSKLREQPQPGFAEGLEQPVLQLRPLPPRGLPHQGGFAEVCLVSALEAALEKAPQTRNFLEACLPKWYNPPVSKNLNPPSLYRVNCDIFTVKLCADFEFFYTPRKMFTPELFCLTWPIR